MESAESSLDFSFAFNELKFSDRTLQIIITPDSLGPDPFPTLNRPRLFHKTKTLHISTPVLSAKSQYFFKLFTNGMAESKEQLVTVQIQESEEAAFMDMLKFMYTNTLSSTTPSTLLDVLMAADKYQVALCMKYCTRLLRDLPMTCESALLYLDLPSTILMAIKDVVHPLVDAAKEFLVSRFSDISKCQDEMLNLPLAAIEVVLSSNHLQIASEDEIYDFLMKWVQRHYTNSQRQLMLTQCLPQLVCLPFLSLTKLNELLKCPDVGIVNASALVVHALSFQTPHRQLQCVSPTLERDYKLRPVKVLTFDLPHKECVVYLDLKHEECARLLPDGHIQTCDFHLDGQTFHLQMWCIMGKEVSSFGLYLCMRRNDSVVRYVVEMNFLQE